MWRRHQSTVAYLYECHKRFGEVKDAKSDLKKIQISRGF